jgi:hypothetical protein
MGAHLLVVNTNVTTSNSARGAGAMTLKLRILPSYLRPSRLLLHVLLHALQVGTRVSIGEKRQQSWLAMLIK